MSDDDIKRLRELAERAREHGYDRTYWLQRLASACGPDVILALLDERDALREAARMALELIESGTRDAVLWAEWEREVLAARDVLRGALGETK